MATARTPATKGTAGWVPPGTIYLNDAGAAPDTLTGAPAERRICKTAGLRHERWYFSDVDQSELWTTPPAGVVAFAIHVLQNEATIPAISMNASRQMLASTASNARAIVHTWSRGAKSRGTGTNVPPVSKGTTGYLAPGGAMLVSLHDSGVADPLAQTIPFRATSDGALQHVVLYFEDIDGTASDTWTPAARVIPRIVDWGWQGVEIGDDLQVAWSSTAATFFGAADSDGWLHLWLR